MKEILHDSVVQSSFSLAGSIQLGTTAQRLGRMILFFVSLHFCGLATAQETITVAVASSLYTNIQQKVNLFEQEHDVAVRLVSGSTGRLYNQILQGAPFDLFIAADIDRPALLAKQGRVIEQFELGQGYLGVVAGKKSLKELSALNNPAIRHIVIANPDVAPFGKKSKEVLMRQGLWTLLQPKFVYAQNALQAGMMVDQGLVDAGLIPVASLQESIAVIEYRGVLLKNRPMALQLMSSVATVPLKQLVSRKP